MTTKSHLSPSKAYLLPVIYDRVGPGLISPAGSLRFWPAWMWWSIISAMTLYIPIIFKKDPGLLSRRMQVKEKNHSRASYAFCHFYLSVIIPGFDYRYQWSAVPVWVVITANVLVSLGYVLIFLVFKENSYASTVIQVDKDQEVIKTGPYAMVRHPMYTGLLIMILFTPLALGSYWGLLFSCLFIPTVLFRIKKEEEVLLRDLSGYKDYYIKTRFSLIPLIW